MFSMGEINWCPQPFRFIQNNFPLAWLTVRVVGSFYYDPHLFFRSRILYEDADFWQENGDSP